jgi:hypothetical protein
VDRSSSGPDVSWKTIIADVPEAVGNLSARRS